MTSKPVSAEPPRRAPGAVLVASTLCYVWGALLVLSAISQVIALASMYGLLSGQLLHSAAIFLVALAYLVAGRTIRRRRPLGFWLGAGLALGTGLLQLYIQINATPVWLGLDALLLILLALNRRAFGIGGGGVDA